MKAKPSPRLFRSLPIVGLPSFLALLLAGLGSPSVGGEDRLPPAELSEETQQIRTELQDVGLRLQSLAKKVEATDAEDAKRMLEAADKIHGSDLGRVIDEISGLLSKSNFIEAVSRQDRAMEELDAIIRILERAQFEAPEDLERKAEELKALLQAAGLMAKKQDSLLQKTKDFIDRKLALDGLKDLKSDLARIKDAQTKLNEGADPEKVDPGAEAADQKALGEAEETAKRLKAEQEAINDRLSKLGGKNLPIGDLKALKEKLDALLAEGDKLASEAEQARDAEQELQSLSALSEASKAQGSKKAGTKAQAGKKATGEKTDDGKPTGDAAGEEKSAENQTSGEPSAGPKAAGEKSAGEKSSGEKAGGEKAAGDKTSGAKSGGEKSSGGKASGEKSDGKEPSGGKPAGENPDGAKPDGTKPDGTKPDGTKPDGVKPDGANPGLSDVELAHRAQELKDAAGKIAEESKDLANKIAKASSELSNSGDVPQGAKDDAEKSSLDAQSAAQELQKGELAKGAEKERAALDNLKKARDQLAKDLAKLEEKNTAETAGLVQEQGLLEKRSEDASSKASQSASQSSSSSARSALEQGSQAMSEASKAMEEAAQASQDGNREKAQAAGQKAKDDLAKAQSALSKGQKDVAQRSAAEKAADLQKKLARKAEEARKQAEELQKKLHKKGDENRGAKLAGAEGSLSKAAGAMQEAGNSKSKGQNELSKKKGEEALSALEKAEASVEDEERDELARLEKEKLKKNAPEQEELARLTKDLAKKAKASSQSPESGESGEQLDQAAESMDQASEDLDKENADAAKKAQEEALAKLKNTKEQLKKEEERLARLKREQEMENMMASLTQVKEAQEKINGDTAKIESGREKSESRRQKKLVEQKVEPLAARQGDLADQVDALNQKLKEEYARVFTFILKNVSADMRQVRDSLIKELETGSYTQFLEKEIVTDIDRLIGALKDEMEKPEPKDSPPGGSQPQQGKPRLVPTVAELRMLKGMQLDVNKGTKDMEDIRKASGGNLNESWRKALDRLLQKQGSVSRMTGELIKDFKSAGAEGGEEGDEPGPDEHDEHDDHD